MKKPEQYDIVLPRHLLHVEEMPLSKHARLKHANEPRAVINVLFLMGNGTPRPEQIIEVDQPICVGPIREGGGEKG